MDREVEELLLFKKKLLLLKLKQREERRKRRWSVRPGFLHRKTEGRYHTAMQRMRDGDHEFFFKYYRMKHGMFDLLLSYVTEDLTRRLVIREPIAPAERLVIALSYLASGKDIKHVAMAYRVAIETALLSIHVSCRAIWVRLKDDFMKVPTEVEWVHIADGFAKTWQFPNCLGAVDGKHIAITQPAKSGSLYYNYKRIQITLIDVGAEGRRSDGGVLKNSEFGKALENRNLGLPSAGELPGTGIVAPYAFVGDEAFQLREDFMRPFPAKQLRVDRRVFNYRLNRVRMCAENALGITAARWSILLRTINLHPKNVNYIVEAACILHNFLTVLNSQTRVHADKEDKLGNITAGQWRHRIDTAQSNNAETRYFALEATHASNNNGSAADARKLFNAYFCSTAGEVSWQWLQPGITKEAAMRCARGPAYGTLLTHQVDGLLELLVTMILS
ncbi:hypothetical protein HPB49_010380 [Dermacentor silvarum]|uniref:Uncharacterized protein n=1 Tax=Dermacentor silvarum TaxID=543639 RepID=A0ACB8DNA0_DERSI|nr:hypothetical protein HPB49_010380 [Dermacentor silvarum]